jgi:hypothetical protein
VSQKWMSIKFDTGEDWDFQKRMEMKIRSGCWARSVQQPHLSCPPSHLSATLTMRGSGLEHLSLDINPATPQASRHRKTCATWQCFNITRSFTGFTRRASSELRHYRPTSPADTSWPRERIWGPPIRGQPRLSKLVSEGFPSRSTLYARCRYGRCRAQNTKLVVAKAAWFAKRVASKD